MTKQNKDNKKQTIYVVAGEGRTDGITYYWHKGKKFYWNVWDNGIIFYKSKQGALRNAKKAKAMYKDSISETYVLQGEEGMSLADFTKVETKNEEKHSIKFL